MFTPQVDNVLAVFSNATGAAMDEGMTWYSDAHDFAKTLDTNLERAVGIVAALSPLSGWNNNRNKAIQFYSQNGIVCVTENGGNGIGLGNSVKAAQAIWYGTHPLDVLKGNKVRAFYRTILEPDSNSVQPVVDRHAFDIAIGRKTDDRSRAILQRKGIYNSFADVYIGAAREQGISSAQMQAVTWVAWKEEHGISA